MSPPCQAPYSGFHCENFYYTYNDAPAHPDLAPFRGMLQSLVFADDVRRAHVTEGPPALANEIVTNGSFARCTVTKLWQRFIGRPMRPEDPVDKAAFDGVVTRFIANNYRLAGLVADLVRLDQYRAGFLPEEN